MEDRRGWKLGRQKIVSCLELSIQGDQATKEKIQVIRMKEHYKNDKEPCKT